MQFSIFGQEFYIFNIDCRLLNPTAIKTSFLKFPIKKKAILDGGKIICSEQIEAALFRACRAELQGNMLAKDWGLEVLLHLKGQHQIRKSMDFFKITEETHNIVIIVNEVLHFNLGQEKGLSKIDLAEIARHYGFSVHVDMCKQIISNGARLILDYY